MLQVLHFRKTSCLLESNSVMLFTCMIQKQVSRSRTIEGALYVNEINCHGPQYLQHKRKDSIICWLFIFFAVGLLFGFQLE